jgi:hypothetical protein
MISDKNSTSKTKKTQEPRSRKEGYNESSASDSEIIGQPPLVPDGRYLVKFIGWATVVMFGKAGKLAMEFQICDGSHLGVKLVRWHNVKPLGKVGKNGRFRTGWGSDLTREYIKLIGSVSRTDRMALTKLTPLLIEAEVVTVASSRRQEALPAALQYSVIRRLIRVEAGRAESF